MERASLSILLRLFSPPWRMQNRSALQGFPSTACTRFIPTQTHPPSLFSGCERPLPEWDVLGPFQSHLFGRNTSVCTSHRSVRCGKVRARNKQSHWPHTLGISRHFPQQSPGCNPSSPAPLPPRRLKNQTAATPFGAGGGNSGSSPASAVQGFPATLNCFPPWRPQGKK